MSARRFRFDATLCRLARDRRDRERQAGAGLPHVARGIWRSGHRARPTRPRESITTPATRLSALRPRRSAAAIPSRSAAMGRSHRTSLRRHLPARRSRSGRDGHLPRRGYRFRKTRPSPIPTTSSKWDCSAPRLAVLMASPANACSLALRRSRFWKQIHSNLLRASPRSRPRSRGGFRLLRPDRAAVVSVVVVDA